ncbi:isoaspartyl peptidase/L-asparaginase isoform X4 [Podarcis raffonei]|uniref:isoaspartyl peptidase/L-asparaginase isoform X4 n=1 Tax=Podarcis raffonei TaxID=65483 RepID=UPI00232988F0|nr:isoaspartyl peptidase/L-asparaginase isoform X4 [Podarcis raffonei]
MGWTGLLPSPPDPTSLLLLNSELLLQFQIWTTVLRNNMKPVIVVHGGAGRIFKDREDGCRSGVTRAALKGYGILKHGGSALDAVEEAVVVMEEDPHFNAGRGSVLNEKGEVEMDAIIMDGKNLASGAVSAVKCIANPIKLARLVMEKTDHMLLTDQGASAFARGMGVPEVPGEKLITERSLERWKKNLEADSNPQQFQKDLGTVGAVAIDSAGNVACATSTGGLTNKRVGRVGDTACIGKSPGDAADSALDCMKTRVGGLGGVIVISNSGDWAARCSTQEMSWATVKDDQLHYGIHAGEWHTQPAEEAISSLGS